MAPNTQSLRKHRGARPPQRTWAMRATASCALASTEQSWALRSDAASTCCRSCSEACAARSSARSTRRAISWRDTCSRVGARTAAKGGLRLLELRAATPNVRTLFTPCNSRTPRVPPPPPPRCPHLCAVDPLVHLLHPLLQLVGPRLKLARLRRVALGLLPLHLDQLGQLALAALQLGHAGARRCQRARPHPPRLRACQGRSGGDTNVCRGNAQRAQRMRTRQGRQRRTQTSWWMPAASAAMAAASASSPSLPLPSTLEKWSGWGEVAAAGAGADAVAAAPPTEVEGEGVRSV